MSYMLPWFCLKDPVHWVDFPHSLCRLLSSWLWSFLSDSPGCAIYDDYIGPGTKQLIDIAYVEDILGKGIVWTFGGSAAPLEVVSEKMKQMIESVGELLFSKRFGEFSTVLSSRKFVYGSLGSPNIGARIYFFSSGVEVRMLQSLPCYTTTLSRQFVDHPGPYPSPQMRRKHVRPRKASLFWIKHRFWCLINMRV